MVTAVEASGFEEAYRLHYSRVRALAGRLVPDAAIADDVAHDVFVWYWRNADKFDESRGSLGAFLAVATRGRAIDRIRADAARRARETRHGEAADVTSPAAELSAVRGVHAVEVRAALDRLPAAERTAIVMAFFGDKTYREVAEALGEPEGTIKSRIRSGLRRLRATSL